MIMVFRICRHLFLIKFLHIYHSFLYVRLQLMQEIEVRNGQLFYRRRLIPYKCHLFKCPYYSKCLISQNDLMLSDLIKWYALRVLRH